MPTCNTLRLRPPHGDNLRGLHQIDGTLFRWRTHSFLVRVEDEGISLAAPADPTVITFDELNAHHASRPMPREWQERVAAWGIQQGLWRD